MIESDTDELGEVAVARPDAQAPLVDGLGEGVADAHRHHLEPVLVGVERPNRLAECLAHPVAAVRAHRDVDPDGLAARIETDRMHAARVDHALRTGLPGRLHDVVGADDVGAEDPLPGPLARDSTHVHHRVDTVDRGTHRVEVREVGSDIGLPFGQVFNGKNVAQPQPITPLEVLSQAGADEPGRAGDEHFLHGFLSDVTAQRPRKRPGMVRVSLKRRIHSPARRQTSRGRASPLCSRPSQRGRRDAAVGGHTDRETLKP